MPENTELNPQENVEPKDTSSESEASSATTSVPATTTSAPNTPVAESTPQAESAPATDPAPAADPAAAADPTILAAPSMDEIDREVADAMASMDPDDLNELSGSVAGEESNTAPGTELIGTVVAVNDDDIFLQFGVKTQGMMPRTQFGKKEKIEVGRRVDVVVDRLDADSDILIVSRKGSLQRATWTNLTKGMLVEGRVIGVIKGGLEINVNGIRAFMPGSQASLAPMKDISILLNQSLQCEVVELDRRAKNVIVSRRKILEKEQAEKRESLKKELEVGQSRTGIVRRITEFGAFVDIGGMDGLLHIRDLSWGNVKKVEDIVSVGQEITVTVLKVDTKRDRISLGLKQSLPNPWTEVESKYPVGTSLKVRVVRTASFGAFAELEPGVEGLIPISEMSWTHVKNIAEVVKEGDIVDVTVIRLEVDKNRLAMSMKQATEDPWANVLESFTEQSIIKGKVTRLTEFGAFVELVAGVEGLIHISEMSDKRIKNCSEVVQEGQEIEARVLGVDKDKRRISLSIKALQEPTAEELQAPAEPIKRKIRKKPLRGGLSSHFDW